MGAAVKVLDQCLVSVRTMLEVSVCVYIAFGILDGSDATGIARVQAL